MIILKRKVSALLAVVLLSGLTISCQRSGEYDPARGPTIEATPVEQGEGPWKVATSDSVTLTVMAPDAATVKILYRPVISTGRHLELGTFNTPTDPARGTFITEWRPRPDFTGSVWAEISYPDGTRKKTEPISLTTRTAIGSQEGQPALDSMGGSLNSDESARADKFTGGRIVTTSLVAGDHRVWITVNVPAFQLTLWQNGREVKTYQIGVGRKNFPLVIGGQKASQIIWNPEWIPPNSPWVEESEDVEPGEVVDADDSRNPLGKVKIPLGNGYLIHQAAKTSDIGHLVSHGCVRMLTDDLFDLAEKIVAARDLLVSDEQMELARTSTERLAVRLTPPLWVDINYDTQVIERGILHLYPDVYNRERQALADLRAELQANGVDEQQLDDQTLKQMLGRVNQREEFVVSIAEIKAGRALVAGQTRPLIKPIGPLEASRLGFVVPERN